MQWVGTSGYNYPEWKGSFYPEKLPAAKMLPFYAARFPTVEINYTFYRMPNEKIVTGWAGGPPELQVHAEGAEAHHARQTAEGRRRPRPRLLRRRRDARRSARRAAVPAAAAIQEGPRRSSTRSSRRCRRKVTAAFEFRHASWFDDERVRPPPRAQPRALRRRQRERPDAGRRDRRLRLLPPARRGLSAGRHRAMGRGRSSEHAAGWRETFVYFKHEEEGRGRSSPRAAEGAGRSSARQALLAPRGSKQPRMNAIARCSAQYPS